MQRGRESIYTAAVRTLGVVTMSEKRAGRLAKPIATPFGRLQAVGVLLSLILAYCVTAIILRYAFDIELWNPF